MLKQAFPQISTVAFLGEPPPFSVDLHQQIMKEFDAAAEALGLQSVAIVSSDNIDDTFAAIRQQRYEAMLVISTRYTITHRAQIIEFAANRRLPAVYARDRFVEAGGLMSYAADQKNLYRRAAKYVDKILKGAKPGDLPIEQPTKFELVINLKTAKAHGFKIPAHILMEADRVIE